MYLPVASTMILYTGFDGSGDLWVLAAHRGTKYRLGGSGGHDSSFLSSTLFKVKQPDWREALVWTGP